MSSSWHSKKKKKALFNIPRTKHGSYHWYSSLSQLETLVAWIPIYLIFYLGQSSCLQDIRYLSRISLPVFCLHKYYISWQYTERELWFWGLFVCLFAFPRVRGNLAESTRVSNLRVLRNSPKRFPGIDPSTTCHSIWNVYHSSNLD